MNEDLTISRQGLSALVDFEGLKDQVYNDSTGNPTIGVGHLLTQQERDTGVININNVAVLWKYGLNKDQVISLLSQDITPREDKVKEIVKVSLNQYQYDALVCFYFNCPEAFNEGTGFLIDLNNGNFEDLPNHWKLYDKSKGEVIDGLEDRRKEEVDIFNGTYPQSA